MWKEKLMASQLGEKLEHLLARSKVQLTVLLSDLRTANKCEVKKEKLMAW